MSVGKEVRTKEKMQIKQKTTGKKMHRRKIFRKYLREIEDKDFFSGIEILKYWKSNKIIKELSNVEENEGTCINVVNCKLNYTQLLFIQKNS